jgi:hypothetical protein
MMLTYRRTALGFVLTAAAALITAANIAPRGRGVDNTNRRATSVPAKFASLNQRAEAAAGNSPEAVRAFTDGIFESSLMGGDVAESLKDRIYRNEFAFRHGQQPGIQEQALVKLANDQIHQHDGASFMYVTVGQLHMSRENMRALVPGLAGASAKGGVSSGRVAGEMSPAEALLMASHLALQKLTNPTYQIRPQEWERQERQRRIWARDHPLGQGKPAAPSVSIGTPVVNLDLITATRLGLASEFNETTATAHRLLDELGVQR